MEPIRIYYNPLCSTCRAALALLEENDISPEIVYYLENPPGARELKELLAKLNLGIRDILRRKESEYSELGLENDSLNEEIIFDIVCKHPRLLQRPILVQGERAVLARPPETVLEFLGK